MSLPTPSPEATALVTGASAGIGAELARSLARRGHGLTLVARREEKLNELAEELRSDDLRVEVIAADLSDPAERDRLQAEIGTLGLRVDILINNAGYGTGGRFHKADRDGELGMVRLNIEALVDLQSRFMAPMVERDSGAILNVASVGAFQPVPKMAVYAATKSFVLSFTEAVRAEVSGRNVTVSALCPGITESEFVEVAGMESEKDRIPGFMVMTSAEVAEEGIEGLEKGKGVIVTGKLNTVSTLLGRHTPRSVLLPIVKRGMGA